MALGREKCADRHPAGKRRDAHRVFLPLVYGAQALYSKDFAADFADDIARMDGSFDYRQYFFDAMDGVLSSDELNTAGKAVAKAYYTTDRTKFAKTHGWYLQDYDDFVARKFGDKNFDNAYFYIENSPQNYAKIKEIIDRRYEEFLATKAAK